MWKKSMVPKKTSKVEAVGASKSVTEFNYKECKACKKEDLYWCEVEGVISVSQ